MHKELGIRHTTSFNEGAQRASCARWLHCSNSSLLPKEGSLFTTQLLLDLCWTSSPHWLPQWWAIRASISQDFILSGVCRSSQWSRKLNPCIWGTMLAPSLPSNFIYHAFLFTVSEGSGRNYKSDGYERGRTPGWQDWFVLCYHIASS